MKSTQLERSPLLSRRSLVGMSAVGVLAAASIGLATHADASTTGPATVNYVALGDSYAAGVGAGTPTNTCGLTAGAYGELWAASKPNEVNLTIPACSGATSVDVVTSQLGDLNRDTNLVSVTVGANDLQLVTVLEICADPTQAATCATAEAGVKTALATTFPQAIATMLATVHSTAPHARLVVTGYPRPFASVADCPTFPVSATLRTDADSFIDALNGVLVDQARRAHATFVDVTRRFTGHELCSADPWLVGVEGLAAGTTLHPTLQGQTEGYLVAFRDRVSPFDAVCWSLRRH
jgi:lysophospholipase L1-like esterase